MSAKSEPILKIAAELKGVGAAARVKIRIAIKKTCADTKADAQIYVPVDTGALRSSITYETHLDRDSVWGEVGPTQDYGGFVELGTSKMAPQPYMRPAFDRRAPILEQILGQMHTGELT